MTYGEALAYLDRLAQFGWKLDLERIGRLCELSGHPERTFPSVLVGGSAGKGSTCAILTSILRAAGLRTGTAPKPHLITFRERVQVDGQLISEAEFAAAMAEVMPLVERVEAEMGPPTVFEAMTLLAFLHFARCRVDRAVVEVGLGGRFDATNVLTPDLSIITMIGLDHTDRLGNTVEEIAFEKAGIIKPGTRLVTGAQGAALEVIEAAAAERGCEVRRLGRDIELLNIRVSAERTAFDLRTPPGELRDLSLPLLGEHQARNAALAVAAAQWLCDYHPQVDDGAIRAGLESASIEGRLQVVRERPLVLLDAAHSPDRADALADTVTRLYLAPGRRVILVIGSSGGHDFESVVRRLAALADEVIATRSDHPASRPAAEVAAAAAGNEAAVRLAETVADAVADALRTAAPDDLVLVTGSMFVAGEALQALTGATEPQSGPDR
jgi:dihydrofolate synthase / folylpolyglutamate synthase